MQELSSGWEGGRGALPYAKRVRILIIFFWGIPINCSF